MPQPVHASSLHLACFEERRGLCCYIGHRAGWYPEPSDATSAQWLLLTSIWMWPQDFTANTGRPGIGYAGIHLWPDNWLEVCSQL